MAARTNRVDEAGRRASWQLAGLVRELRAARVSAGLSQATVARAVGCSRELVKAWESGRSSPSVTRLARWACAVGLDVPLRTYPGGSPLRDAGQLRALGRARATIGGEWAWRAEVPVSSDPLDRRAVDAVLELDEVRVGVEVVSRLGDAQAEVRRAILKQEVAQLDRLLLVLPDTRHNRRAVMEGAATLRSAFPLASRAVLAALRAGRLPGANGVLLV